MKTLKPPSDLGPAGRQLWAQIEQNYDISAVLPSLAELCRCADRLQQIRAAYLADGGAAGPRADKHIGSECRVLNQFRQLSKSLGLNDTEKKVNRG